MNSKQTEGKDPFIEKHLAIIKQKIKDGLIEVHIARMGEFEKASIIKYFLEKVTVNCSFREKLNDLLDGMGASKNDQSLPSNPVGDVEDKKTFFEWLNNNRLFFVDEVRGWLKMVDSGDISFSKFVELFNDKVFKSGYAAAPQKGMRWVKASERLPEKEGLVHYHIENGLHDVCFYHKQRGFYKPKMVNPTSERMKLDRDLELIPLPYSLDKIYYLDESPSPSEAGDGWISVEDGLPEKRIRVIGWPDIGGYDMVHVDFDGIWKDDQGSAVKHPIVKWQPLPAPPIQKTVK